MRLSCFPFDFEYEILTGWKDTNAYLPTLCVCVHRAVIYYGMPIFVTPPSTRSGNSFALQATLFLTREDMQTSLSQLTTHPFADKLRGL